MSSQDDLLSQADIREDMAMEIPAGECRELFEEWIQDARVLRMSVQHGTEFAERSR